jgi:hypothetical protein
VDVATDPKQAKKVKLEKPKPKTKPTTTGSKSAPPLKSEEPKSISKQLPAVAAVARKPRKKAADFFHPEDTDTLAVQATEPPAPKAHKGKSKGRKSASPIDNDDFLGFGSDADSAAENPADLLAGFETSSESGSDPEEDGIPLANLPVPPTPDAQTVTDAKKKGGNREVPGVLYVGSVAPVPFIISVPSHTS